MGAYAHTRTAGAEGTKKREGGGGKACIVSWPATRTYYCLCDVWQCSKCGLCTSGFLIRRGIPAGS